MTLVRRLRHLLTLLVCLGLAGCGSADAVPTGHGVAAGHQGHGRHLRQRAGGLGRSGASSERAAGGGGGQTRALANLQFPALPAFSSLKVRPVGRSAVFIPLPAPWKSLSPAPVAAGAATTNTPLHAALKTAPPGSVIQLASGEYPKLETSRASTDWITISGVGDATPPVIDGAVLKGAQFLRFVGVTFSHAFHVTTQSALPGYHPSDHIQLLNSEVDCGSTTTLPSTTAILIRGGNNVSITGDLVHNCVVGFDTLGQDPVSTGLSITHSTFEHFPGDAIDLGALSGVVIDHNIIRDIADPAGKYHDDGIQFLGNVAHVQITNNVLSNSERQLIFIQDAVKSRITHSSVNSDILVAHNLIYGAGAIAVQAQGAEDTRFIGNTMWDNHFGSLLLRRSGFTGISPTDTFVYGNIIDGFGRQGVRPAYEDHNLIVSVPGFEYSRPRAGKHDLLHVDPRFVAAAKGDFQLVKRSRARNRASVPVFKFLTTGVTDLAGDMYGHPYPPHQLSLGAVQSADPRVLYGPLVFGPAPLR